MKAASYSETSVIIYHLTRHHIPEHMDLHQHSCGNSHLTNDNM